MGGGSCLNHAAFGRLLTLLLGMAVLAALFLCSNSLSSIFFVNTQLNWLSVDFNNWKDWEDDSDEDMSNFDRFSEVQEDEFLELWVSFGWGCGQAVTDGFRELFSSAFLLLSGCLTQQERPLVQC